MILALSLSPCLQAKKKAALMSMLQLNALRYGVLPSASGKLIFQAVWKIFENYSKNIVHTAFCGSVYIFCNENKDMGGDDGEKEKARWRSQAGL